MNRIKWTTLLILSSTHSLSFPATTGFCWLFFHRAFPYLDVDRPTKWFKLSQDFLFSQREHRTWESSPRPPSLPRVFVFCLCLLLSFVFVFCCLCLLLSFVFVFCCLFVFFCLLSIDFLTSPAFFASRCSERRGGCWCWYTWKWSAIGRYISK